MRTLLAVLVVLAISSLAQAQTPEQLLPADCVFYLRYDGYKAHKKAYDQTALATVMKEGLGDFLDHLFTQIFTAAGDDVPPRQLKKGEGRRLAADRFFAYVWDHGLAASADFAPPKADMSAEELLQFTIVFPQGAKKQNRAAIDDFLTFCAKALEVEIEAVKHNGRAGHACKFGDSQAQWWPEGDHLVLTFGVEPAKQTQRVIDGKRRNVTQAPWHQELTAFKRYETDLRGYVNLEAIINRFSSLGLEEPTLTNFKERMTRRVIMSHLGLTGLKDVSFHLGFDGKYQRSTVRLGVAERDKRGGLLNLLTGPMKFDPLKLPPLPPDADYVSVRHVNWHNMYDYIRSNFAMLAVAELLDGEMPANRFPDLDRALGIDFRKDFLDQLDTSLVSWGAHSEGPFFLGQGFAVKVKDAAKVKKGLAAIAKKLHEFEPTVLASETKTYRGVEMRTFHKLPLPFTLAVHENQLLFGLFPQPVQGVILRSGGKYRTWKAPAELAAAFAKNAGEDKSKLFHVGISDPRPTIEIGLSMMPLFAHYVNSMAGFKLMGVGDVPNAQSINEWLFPNVALGFDDGNALRWEHLYSINEPDDLLLAQFLPTMAPYLNGVAPIRLTRNRRNAAPAVVMPAPVPVMPAANDVPKKPTLVKATAEEKDGEVRILVKESKQVAYSEETLVPEKIKKKVVEDGVEKEVEETVQKKVFEARVKTVETSRSYVVDGKKIQATRKDGKAVEPSELPKLLKEETQILLAPAGEIAPEELRKIDDATLIIRVTEERPPAPPAFPGPEPAKKPMLVKATAEEKDGVVRINTNHVELVPYTIAKKVPYTETVKVEVDGVLKDVSRTGYQTVQETAFKEVATSRSMIVDGKNVKATRKDGKAVEPAELPKLLKAETKILLVSGDIDPEELRKLDDATLIIRVPKTPPAPNNPKADPLIRPLEKIPAPRKVEPAKPVSCPARAIEKDGAVVLQVQMPRDVSYEVSRFVRGAYVDPTGNAYVDDGPDRKFQEGAVAKKQGGGAAVQVSIAIKETNQKTVMETHRFPVDGKNVYVTRKNGKSVDAKELLTILKNDVQVVVIRGAEPDRAFLEKLDDDTLIVRIAP